MRKISVIHPSRGRAALAEATFKKWRDSAYDRNSFEYVLSIDRDDPQQDQYASIRGIDQKIVSYNKSCIEATNEGARYALGDIFLVSSDDFSCPMHWDKLLLDALEGKEDFLAKTDDGCQPWIITMPLMDRVYYNRYRYIYPPHIIHMFADTWMTAVADHLGRKIVLPIKFPHDHYTTGINPKDEINKRNDATWAQGEAEYLKGVRTNFGLTDFPGKPDWDEGHIKWLKNKGIDL